MDDERLRAAFDRCSDGALQTVGRRDFDEDGLHAQSFQRGLAIPARIAGNGRGGVYEHGDASNRWHDFAQERDALRFEFGAHHRNAGDVSAGMRKTRHEARADRIGGGKHDDGNGSGCLASSNGRFGSNGDDQLYIERDEFLRE